jgi:hypothetical protein
MKVIESIPHYAIADRAIYLAYGDRMSKLILNEEQTWGISPPPANLTVALAGTAGNMTAGTYLFHVVAHDASGVMSNPWKTDSNPIPASLTLAADSSAVTATLPTHPNPRVKYMSVYRTRMGELGPFYFAGRVLNGTATLTINGGDESLPSDDFLEGPAADAEDESNNAGPFKYGRPPSKTICVSGLDGRILVAGERAYTAGSATATASSAVINFSSQASLTSGVVGKYFRFVGDSVRYEITSLVSPTSIRLSTNYTLKPGETTYPTAAEYEIIGNPNEVYASEPGWPEYFPPIPLNVGSEDGGYITAMVAFFDDVLVFTESSIYRLFTSGASVGSVKTGATDGAVSRRGVVVTPAGVAYFTGREVCMYANGNSAVMSSAISSLLETTREDMRQYAIMAYLNGRIYLAVSHDSDEHLDTIYVLSLATTAWDRWSAFRIIDMQSIRTAAGSEYLYIEQPASSGYVVSAFADYCLNDGAGTSDYGGSVVSATSRTVTVGTVLPTGGVGLAGMQIRIVAGTGLGQEAWITSNTADTITVESAWRILPDSTSIYTIGGIRMSFASGKTSPDPQAVWDWRAIEVRMTDG